MWTGIATEFKSKRPTLRGWERTLPEAIRSLNDNLDARGGLCLGELLTKEVPEVPQTQKATAATVGYMPELDDKTLLLKTLHVYTLTIGHGKIRLGLNWKFPPCWLAFRVPEGAVQAAGGDLSPRFLLGYELRVNLLTCMAGYVYFCSTSSAVVGERTVSWGGHRPQGKLFLWVF